MIEFPILFDAKNLIIVFVAVIHAALGIVISIKGSGKKQNSIFAIMAEEIGFLFTVAFIVLIMLICFRGLRIAKNAPDVFSKLLVSGIIIWFVSQSFFLCSFLPNNYFNMCALHLNSSFPARTPSCFSPVCLGTTELCSDWGFVARGFNQRRERRRLSRS